MRYLPEFLDRGAQEQVLRDLRQALEQAPLVTPVMPKTAKPFSVRMSNVGPLGWVSDKSGYRYQATHPATGLPWPAIPSKHYGRMDQGFELCPSAGILPG